MKKNFLSLFCLLLCVLILATACDHGAPEQSDERNTAEQTEGSATDPNANDPTKKSVTYTVTVKSAEGGIEGVELRICNQNGICSPKKGVTDDRGVAVITVNAEHYGQDVSVRIDQAPMKFGLITDPSAPDFNAAFPIENGQTAVEITLSEKIVYSVKCSELISGAMKDVLVTLYYKNSDGTMGGVAGTQVTNAVGEAIFYFWEAGDFIISLDESTIPQGFIKATDGMELTVAQKSAVIGFVAPDSQCDKTFTVKNADNSPAVGVTVTLYGTGNDPVAEGVTDSAGRVTFKALSDTVNYKIVITEAEYVLEETDLGTLGVPLNAADIAVTLTDPAQIPNVEYTVQIIKKDDESILSAKLSATVFHVDSHGTHVKDGDVTLINGVGWITLKKRDDYFVKLNGIPDGWQICGSNPYAGFMTDQGNTATFVLDDAGTTAADPIIWNNGLQAERYSNALHLTLRADQTVWIEAQNPKDMMLLIEDPNVTVTCNGTQYTAQDGVVRVILGEGERVLICVRAAANVTVAVLCCAQ